MEFKDIYMHTGVVEVGPLAVNCYILWDINKECVVVDPGDDADKIIAALETEGLEPSNILLTHGHFDHIGAVNALKAKYGCKVYIGELDAPMLENPTAMGVPLETVVPDILLKPGDRFQIGNMRFEAIHTPGHTKGGVTYKIYDYLITGDTLFAGDIGRTDLPGGDYEQMMKSLKIIKRQKGPDNGDAKDYSIMPGHGEQSSLMYETHTNPYLLQIEK